MKATVLQGGLTAKIINPFDGNYSPEQYDEWELDHQNNVITLLTDSPLDEGITVEVGEPVECFRTSVNGILKPLDTDIKTMSGFTKTEAEKAKLVILLVYPILNHLQQEGEKSGDNDLLEALQGLLKFCKSHQMDNYHTQFAERVIYNTLKQ